MTPADQTAFDLTNKLVAGEDGEVSSHLAMLLEKSSPLADSEEHYRCILPPELAGLTFSAETRDQIIAILCAEILRNPKESLIAGDFVHRSGFGNQDRRENSNHAAAYAYPRRNLGSIVSRDEVPSVSSE